MSVQKVCLALFISIFFLFFLSGKILAFYSPDQIKAAYNLPADGGSGTVAIIGPKSLNVENDLETFSTRFGLSPCNQGNGCLTIHDVTTGQSVDSVESYMDTQWVHAIAPQAKILLVEIGSPDGHRLNENDLRNAIGYAESQSDVTIISMSLGGPDDSLSLCGMFTKNVPHLASSGDYGGDAQQGVGWPAVCPNVIAVGGTTLQMSGNTFASEKVWNGSGGGLSQSVPEPSYQVSYGIPNANGFRGEPDIAALADPHTGATVYYYGGIVGGGGTSLSAPIWAGIAALSGGQITHDLLYTNAKNSYSSYYRDITSGSNGYCSYYCQARDGYDYITGLGVPNGLPTGGGSIPNPAATSTPTPTITPTPNNAPLVHNITINFWSDINNSGNKEVPPDTVFTGVVNKIELLNSSGATILNGTTSNGSYTFSNISQGTYNVRITIGTGYVPLTTQNPIVITDSDYSFDVLIPPTSANPPVIVVPTATPTMTPAPNSGGGGGGGAPTPTPTPQPTYKCVEDHSNCTSGQKNLQLCPLKCTPN